MWLKVVNSADKKKNRILLQGEKELGKHKGLFEIRIRSGDIRTSSVWHRRSTQVPIKCSSTSCAFSAWSDLAEGFKTILNFIGAIFSVKSVFYKMKYRDANLALRILSHAKTLEGSRIVEWDFVDFYECETTKKFLDVCSDFTELKLQSDLPSSLEYHNFHTFSMQKLKISNGNWITLKDIFAMVNVKKIDINQVALSAQDLNLIVKKWMSGDLSGVENIHLLSRRGVRYSADVVMNGVENEDMFENSHFKIRRRDGIEAIVVFQPFLANSTLFMIVQT